MLEIRTRNGSTIRAEGAALKILELGLSEMTADLKKMLEGELNDIKRHAVDNWPYDFRRSKSLEFKPHSRDQFKVKSKHIIEKGGVVLESALHNDAQYAYMIQTSEIFDSKTKQGRSVPLPRGSHVFSKLLWQPMTKGALRVAQKSARIYINMLKRRAS